MCTNSCNPDLNPLKNSLAVKKLHGNDSYLEITVNTLDMEHNSKSGDYTHKTCTDSERKKAREIERERIDRE